MKAKDKLFIALVFILIAASFTLISTRGATSEEIEEFNLVIVERGDTLWSIAKKFANPEQDVRNMIHIIRRVNKLDSAVIHPGDQLLIPSI